MRFIATADTDIGTTKNTNQDSAMIKHAMTEAGEVLMAVVCDGMGGLANGELASATVVRAFSKWFNETLPIELEHADMQIIGLKWSNMLKDLNQKILQHGSKYGNMGTTFSGMLFIGNAYLIVHVGDTRVYQIGNRMVQLTEDQTFVAREIRNGNMTVEQAKKDRRRNMLLQCVGASKRVEPQVITGRIERGMYMICSDGFRHEVSEAELFQSLHAANFADKQAMHGKARYLIDLVKSRGERDNISVVLIKADQ